MSQKIECAHCGRKILEGWLCEDCSDAEWDSYWDSQDADIGQSEQSEQDEWKQDDDRQRAADLNAALRDIGGGLR